MVSQTLACHQTSGPLRPTQARPPCPPCPPCPPASHRAVASLPRASLGCSSGGRGQPSSRPVSKAGGGDGERRRRGRREVEQLQHGHAHAAAPREHAGRRHPLVAAGVVLLDGVEAGAAVVASHSVQPAVHGHQVVGAPGPGRQVQHHVMVHVTVSRPNPPRPQPLFGQARSEL